MRRRMEVTMKSLLTILFAAAVLLAASAFAGVAQPGAAHGDAATTTNVVTTVGHGAVTAVPDLATISAGVHTEAATAVAALARNSDEMSKVIAAVKRAGGQKVQTQQVPLS